MRHEADWDSQGETASFQIKGGLAKGVRPYKYAEVRNKKNRVVGLGIGLNPTETSLVEDKYGPVTSPLANDPEMTYLESEPEIISSKIINFLESNGCHDEGQVTLIETLTEVKEQNKG